jgi:thioredoxin 1
MVFEITNETDLFSLFRKNNNTLLMVSASWCNPCKLIKPEFYKFSQIYKNISFVYIDITKYNNESKKFIDDNVKALPTFLYCKNNNIVNKMEGGNKQLLEQFINNNNRLVGDMNNRSYGDMNNNELDSYWNMSNNIIN